jgi:uncharacterized membrane protein YeiH
MLSKSVGVWLVFVGVLYHFFLFEEASGVLSIMNENLEKMSFDLLPFLPSFSFLDFCGSILCCVEYRRLQRVAKPWWHVLWACTMMQFGGTTITGLLLGQTPSWIVSQKAFPAMLLAWWLVFFSPFDYCWRLYHTNRVFSWYFGFFSAISSAHATSSWGMDKALFNAFHVNSAAIRRSILTCLACGTFSACGGGILADTFGFLGEPSATLRTVSFNKSFILALLYFSLVNARESIGWSFFEMPLESARCLLSIINIFHFTMQLIDPSINYFASITAVVLKLCGIDRSISPKLHCD